MEILLHIGQSKTGTSAIQRFLSDNRPALARRGILYPKVRVGAVSIDLEQHNPVADALSERYVYPSLSADEYISQFFQAARDQSAQKMIISAEHFFGGEPRIWDVTSEASYFEKYRAKLDRLAKLLAGNSIKILVYLRPQVAWLGSAVGQTVKLEGLIGRGQIYVDDSQFFELAKPVLRYGTLLRHWQEAFAGSEIVAVPYVREQLHNKSSVADFNLRAGIDDTEMTIDGPSLEVNPSFSLEFLEIKKEQNRIPHSKARERSIIRCLGELSRKSDFRNPYVLDQDVIDAVEAFCADENRYVNEHFAAPGTTLSASAPIKSAGPRPSPADIDRARRTFEAEHRRLRFRVVEADDALRALLRERARPVYAVLHRIKRMVRQ